jgi:hypothetical protein
MLGFSGASARAARSAFRMAEPFPFRSQGFPFAVKRFPFAVKGILFELQGIPFEMKGNLFEAEGIPFGSQGFPFVVKGFPFEAEGMLFEMKGLPFAASLFPCEKSCRKKRELTVLCGIALLLSSGQRERISVQCDPKLVLCIY